jgi:hypothetical protein
MSGLVTNYNPLCTCVTSKCLQFLSLFLLQGFTEPTSDKLLPDLLPAHQHVFTLVLDLNETLVYSDWQVFYGFILNTEH